MRAANDSVGQTRVAVDAIEKAALQVKSEYSKQVDNSLEHVHYSDI